MDEPQAYALNKPVLRAWVTCQHGHTDLRCCWPCMKLQIDEEVRKVLYIRALKDAGVPTQ